LRRRHQSPAARRSGFTLIEMLAVVAIFGLIAAMALPNIDLGGSRIVRGEAQDLATAIEFARQRAVMTGRTHRGVIEVERGEHGVEWAPRRAEAVSADAGAPEKKTRPRPPPLETEEFVRSRRGGRVHRERPDAIPGSACRRPRGQGRVGSITPTAPPTRVVGSPTPTEQRARQWSLADAVRVVNAE
jgi:type II secretion system protein H